jgi:hypothetical protein
MKMHFSVLTCAGGYAIVTRGKQPFSQEPVDGIILNATSVRQLLLVSLLFYQPTYGLVAARCLTPEL